MARLTRKSLSRELARRSRFSACPVSTLEAEVLVNLMLEIMREVLTQPGGAIELQQFGIFEIVSSRYGGHILRGEQGRAVQPRYRITFRASSSIYDALKAHYREAAFHEPADSNKLLPSSGDDPR